MLISVVNCVSRTAHQFLNYLLLKQITLVSLTVHLALMLTLQQEDVSTGAQQQPYNMLITPQICVLTNAPFKKDTLDRF
jgi:hypothetical protein